MNVSCSSLSQSQFLDYDFDYVSVKNLSVDNGHKDTITFSGKTYLFATYSHYGHTVMDIFAQLKILQIVHPDIKPVFYEQSSKGFMFNNSKVVSDMINILGENSENIIDISKNNYVFEEVILFFDMCNLFSDEFYSKHGATRTLNYFPFCKCYMGSEPCGTSKHFKYNYLAIDTLRKFLSPYFSQTYEENVYISREHYNAKWLNDILHYANKDSLSEEEKHLLWVSQIRYYKDEPLIQSFFKSRGYKIIKPEEHGFIDQIKIFSNAKRIVSLSGTGLFNAMWSNSTANIFELISIPEYKYHYEQFIKHAGANYNKVDVYGMSDYDILKVLINNVEGAS